MSLIRHTLATLAYRGGRSLRGAPESFAGFRVSEQSRTPEQIVAHIGDLFDWALSIAKGRQAWRESPPLPWDQEVQRFFAALTAFDDYLASGAPVHASEEKLFQGPIADAFTHIGQIAMLRRAAGCPIRGENYYRAKIEEGSVGEEQPAPVQEFE